MTYLEISFFIHSKTLKVRYSNYSLKKDFIGIEDSKEIKISNILACITEYWTLIKYKDYKKYMLHKLKHSSGGTECFYKDILKNKDINYLIMDTVNNIDFLFDTFKFNDDNKKLIKKIIKKDLELMQKGNP